MLVDGKWTEDWHPVQAKDARGGFVRQTSSFRRWIGDPGRGPERGRYRLIVSLTCPWASRALIARKLKGLENAVDVSIVEPELGPRGWRFADGRALADVYVAADPHYTGRDGAGALGREGTDFGLATDGYRRASRRHAPERAVPCVTSEL